MLTSVASQQQSNSGCSSNPEPSPKVRTVSWYSPPEGVMQIAQNPTAMGDAAPTAKGMLAELLSAWRLWRCNAKETALQVPQGFPATGDAMATGGFGVGHCNAVATALQCPNGGKRCDGCPRFQAFRQRAAINHPVTGQRDVLVCATKVEAHGGDRHSKVADVHQGHADVVRTVVGNECTAHPNAQAHPVGVEVAPPVQDAQHGTEQRSGQRDGLHERASHTAQHSSRRLAVMVAVGAALCALIAVGLEVSHGC